MAPKLIIQTMYGYQGLTQRPYHGGEDTANHLVTDQAQIVETFHQWGTSKPNTHVSIICGDLNLIYDPASETSEPDRFTARAQGTLCKALDDWQFVDALRERAGPERRIITHCGIQDGGSYLDRILVRGAEVIQAGIQPSGQTIDGLRLDHHIVVADISVHALMIDLPEGNQPRPGAKLSKRFLDIADNYTQYDNLPAKFEDLVLECTTNQMQQATVKISSATQAILRATPRTPVARASLLIELGDLLDQFLTGIYFPLLTKVQAQYDGEEDEEAGRSKGKATKTKAWIPSQQEQNVISRLALATSARQGAHIDAAKPMFHRLNAPAKSTLHDRTLLLHQAYTALYHTFSQRWINDIPLPQPPCAEELRLRSEEIPSDPTNSAEQHYHDGQGETRLRQLQDMIASHGDYLEKLIETQSFNEWRSRTQKLRDRNDIAGLFAACNNRRRPKVPAVTSFTYQTETGESTLARSNKDFLIATYQQWQQLYGVNHWRANPPPIFRHSTDPLTGLQQVRLNSYTGEEAAELQEDNRRAYQAFELCAVNDQTVNWQAVLAPISTADFDKMERSRRRRSPGASGFKSSCLRFLPHDIRQVYRDLMQCMWLKQAIPDQILLHALLTLIRKPNGGERGVSLLEETFKDLDALFTRRILTLLQPGKTIDDLLCPFNWAYKPHRGCEDVLHNYSLTVEHAARTQQPLVVMLLDLAKFFDTIQVDVVETVLRLKGAPDNAIRLFRAFYDNSTISVDSMYGKTEPFRRRIGVHQGAAGSCLWALLALEPFHRLQRHLATYPGDHTTFCFQRVSVPPAQDSLEAEDYSYCDDLSLFSSSIIQANTKLSYLAPALSITGIGVDSKADVLAFNMELGLHPQQCTVILPKAYDYRTGLREDKSFRIQSGEEASYRLLGVHFKGAFPDNTANKMTGRLFGAVSQIKRFSHLKLSLDVTRQLILQTVVASLTGYAPLHTAFPEVLLSKFDTTLAGIGKTCVHLPHCTPRLLAFLPQRLGGLGMPSVQIELVISTARTLMALLNRADHVGEIARVEFHHLCLNPPVYTPKGPSTSGIIGRSLHRLTAAGVHVRDKDEQLVNRILDELAAQQPLGQTHRPTQNPAALLPERQSTTHLLMQSSSISHIAIHVRSYVSRNTNSSTPHLASGPTITPQGIFDNIVTAALKATAKSQEDLRLFGSTVGMPAMHMHHYNDGLWESGPYALQHQLLKLAIRSHLESPVNRPPQYAALSIALGRVPPMERHLIATAVDGSPRGASLVFLLPSALPPHEVSLYKTLPDIFHRRYGTHHMASTPTTLATIKMWFPPQIGTEITCSYDTEAGAKIVDLIIRSHCPPMGPCFIDNLAVHHRASAYNPQASSTERNKEARVHIHNHLEVWQKELSLLPTLPRPLRAVARSSIIYWNLKAPRAHYAHPRRLFVSVKVKSHTALTAEPGGKPLNVACTLGHHGNAEADRYAGEASEEAILPQLSGQNPLLYPPFDQRFVAVVEGKVITCKLAKYLRASCSKQHFAHVRDKVKRPIMGRPTRVRCSIHPAAIDLLYLDKIGPPISYPLPHDLHQPVAMSLRLNLRIGSWAYMTQNGRIEPQEVALRYQQQFPALIEYWNNRHLAEAASIHTRRKQIRESCPLCASEGIFRRGCGAHYRSLDPEFGCVNATIRAAIHQVLSATEGALQQAAPTQVWLQHAQYNLNPMCLTPTPQYISAIANQYPILCTLRWVVDTTHDRGDELYVDPEGTVYSMGMRVGTFPRSLRHPLSPDKPLSREIVHDIEGTKRNALIDWWTTVQAILLNHWETLQQDPRQAIDPHLDHSTTQHGQDQTRTEPERNNERASNAGAEEHLPALLCQAQMCPQITHRPGLCPTHLASYRVKQLVRCLAKSLEDNLYPQHANFGITYRNLVESLIRNPCQEKQCGQRLLPPLKATISNSALGPLRYLWGRLQLNGRADPSHGPFRNSNSTTLRILNTFLIPYRSDTDPSNILWKGSHRTGWCSCGPTEATSHSSTLSCCSKCHHLVLNAWTDTAVVDEEDISATSLPLPDGRRIKLQQIFRLTLIIAKYIDTNKELHGCPLRLHQEPTLSLRTSASSLLSSASPHQIGPDSTRTDATDQLPQQRNNSADTLHQSRKRKRNAERARQHRLSRMVDRPSSPYTDTSTS